MAAVVLLGFAFAVPAAQAQLQSAQSGQRAITVSDQIFTSRWVAPQADVMLPEPVIASDEIEPVTDVAAKLREGIYFGSLRISPGLGAGWEYSNRNSGGQETDSNNDSSFYLAPSLGLRYARDFGPWSLALGYGGGYVFYLNPDYNPSGSSRGRNPLDQTIGLRIGHAGLRHELAFTASATYGTGQNIQIGGGTTTTTTAFAGLEYTYLLTEYVTFGTYMNVSTQVNQYGNDNNQSSEIYSARMGGFLNWLATGKTTVGLNAEAGFSVQSTQADVTVLVPQLVAATPQAGTTNAMVPVVPMLPPVARTETTTDTVSRQYAQLLVTAEHTLTSKLVISGGLGAGFVTDSDVENAEYTGIRPVYQLSVDYKPSEKTSVRLYSNFEGIVIVPDYGLVVNWSPRQTTSFGLSIYQNQNYSLNTTSQFQVNRGFTLSVSQRIFSKVRVNLSGGWQQTQNLALSEDQTDGATDEFAFLRGGIRWDLNDWLYWETTLYAISGNRNGGSNDDDFPETTATTGLNLIF
jgi:CBS domain-containing protein